jgi:regulator of replication initiation timing
MSKFNPANHIIGKVYDLTQKNMSFLVTEFEKLSDENKELKSENNRLRAALLKIYTRPQPDEFKKIACFALWGKERLDDF